MKASMILLIVLCELTKALIREHFYVNIRLTWTGAQSYCRKYYEDLSTITSQEEQDMLLQLAGRNTGFKWIGLYRDMTNTSNFLWSDGNSLSFTDWSDEQPDNTGGNQNCVMISSKWFDYYCNSMLTFFCGETKFILVKEKKTWEEALQYCRTHHTDLASITNKRQLQLTKNKTSESQTERVWTGLLYLDGEWSWANNNPLGDQVLLSECPAHDCGARNIKNDTWEDRDCAEKLNFLCS
ncbi:macrophage mannose receptor 1-like protein [Labeo rohita]|uniref:Macrophage mannose receptor 1-like protein n=1 Tax=Labeo rohita TaxID=84645 RepID=A0A498L7I5_LABRO|nr:macrophage mannose receptor 1-like protein [Labeo rohita]